MVGLLTEKYKLPLDDTFHGMDPEHMLTLSNQMRIDDPANKLALAM